MSHVYLKDGRRIDITYDESVRLAKYIMLIPDFKVFMMGGVSFATKDIDYEAERLSKLPQQMKLEIRTKTY